jgi:hypothetical protein
MTTVATVSIISATVLLVAAIVILLQLWEQSQFLEHRVARQVGEIADLESEVLVARADSERLSGYIDEIRDGRTKAEMQLLQALTLLALLEERGVKVDATARDRLLAIGQADWKYDYERGDFVVRHVAFQPPKGH